MSNFMTDEQRKAQELWLASATYDTDFKPMTMPALVKILHDEYEILTSTSAVGRWKQKFKWEELLEVQVSASMVEDEKVRALISSSSMKENVDASFDDFRANEAIKNGAYGLAKKQLEHYERQMEKNKSLSDKDMKMVVELLKLTSERKDKLLDRKAFGDASEKNSFTDLLISFQSGNVPDELIIEVEE